MRFEFIPRSHRRQFGLRRAGAQQNGGERGQALIEFSLSIGVLLLLFLGLAGMAWGFFAWLTTTSASREGARFVIGDPQVTYDEVVTHICSTGVMMGGSSASCEALEDAGEITVLVEPADISSRVSGAQITVNVGYRVPVPTLRASFFNGGGITFLGPIWVNSRSVMRIE
ncbi:MAG: pilus assembly protein [Anaerolineae bacterium]|nr:pilus assembly protein [Anaerolineae bacterium]